MVLYAHVIDVVILFWNVMIVVAQLFYIKIKLVCHHIELLGTRLFIVV